VILPLASTGVRPGSWGAMLEGSLAGSVADGGDMLILGDVVLKRLVRNEL
jgi:hypothetical protein